MNAQANITRRYVDTRHGQVHLRMRQGDLDGLTLMLLHQTASSSAMFEALISALPEAWTCLAPDTPGYGGTPLSKRLVSIAGYAEVMVAALHALNTEACWVFGHHTGAAIAIQMAFDHPEMVEKLVLSGPPLLTDAQKQHLGGLVGPMQIADNGTHVMKIWDRIRGRMPEGASPDLLHREAMLSMQAGQHYHETYHAVFAQNVETQLRAITCPVLMVAGEYDTLIDSLEPAHRLVPHSQKTIVSGASTYYCDTHAVELATLLTEFFAN